MSHKKAKSLRWLDFQVWQDMKSWDNFPWTATCVVWLKPNVSTVNICLLPEPRGPSSWGCSVSGAVPQGAAALCCKVCNYTGNFDLSLEALCLDLSRQTQDWNTCKNPWTMGASISHTHSAVHQHSSYRLTTKPFIPPLQPRSFNAI